MTRRSGVQHRLTIAFVIQFVLISLATVLSVLGSAQIIEKVLVKQALVMEAEHFWSLYDADPEQARPNTRHLLGLLASAEGGDALPPELFGLAPGYYRVPLNDREPIVYVDGRDDMRLYLIFDEQRVSQLAFLFGILPLIVVLLIIYLSSFLTWRKSRQLVSPLVQLAEVLRSTSALEPQGARPDLSVVEAEADSEVAVLVAALENYADRLVGFVERERQFTRDASHELRTPLAVIRANLELLAGRQGSSPSLRRIEDTVDDMESLIETLLLLARTQARDVPEDDLIVNDLVINLVERLAPLAERKNVHVRIQQQAMLSLRAAETVVTIVLTNLLRNAINYTGTGEATVVIAERSIVVQDTGPGMDAEELARVLQPFERGQQSGEPGTGLGLAIVQRLCERFNWKLSFASAPGKGTQVQVTFAPWQHRSATL